MQDYIIMSRDTCVAAYVGGKLEVHEKALLPLYLARTNNLEGWLETRAIDGHRANSRLLKKALRLENKDDVSTVLHFNAATITDTYWVKIPDSPISYEDIRFKENYFDTLALRGDPDSFNRKPSRTPELTNTGSFEKCWRLIDGQWWMYKSESAVEQFTELFAYFLAKELSIPVAVYEKDGNYVRSLDFTNGASVNFETAHGIIGDEADYRKIYNKLLSLDDVLAASYITMTYFDALIFNMDRHEHNFGVLRDVESGRILGMAPLYDHNIALITRGFPGDVKRSNDRLLGDFIELLHAEHPSVILPEITPAKITTGLGKTFSCFPDGINLPENTEQFIKDFVMNGYRHIRERSHISLKKPDRSDLSR